MYYLCIVKLKQITIQPSTSSVKSGTMTQKNETPSLRSPKNRYRVEVHYPQPLDGVGSVVSFGTMSLEGIDDYIRRYWMNNQPKAYVVIRENKKTYPEFDWQTGRTGDIEA